MASLLRRFGVVLALVYLAVAPALEPVEFGAHDSANLASPASNHETTKSHPGNDCGPTASCSPAVIAVPDSWQRLARSGEYTATEQRPLTGLWHTGPEAPVPIRFV